MAGPMSNGTRVLVDATNKSAAIEFTHAVQPWVDDSVRVWTNNRIRRYNVGCFVRLTNWTLPFVIFDAIVTSGAFGDALMTVVVDGVPTSVTMTTDAREHRYIVPVTVKADGTSIVDIREKWGGNNAAQNLGVDSARDGGYVTAVQVPAGYVVQRAQTGSVGIITVGDSTLGSVGVTASQATLGNWGSVATSLGQLALARGWMLTQLEYGGACLAGDGLTAPQYVALIQQAAACMGNPAIVRVLFVPFRNDYMDGAAGVQTTPTQGGAFLQAIVNGLPASYQKFGCTHWPNDSEPTVNTFTAANWRAAAAAVTGMTKPWLDGTSLGLSAGDRSDGIHMKASGITKALAGVQPLVGL